MVGFSLKKKDDKPKGFSGFSLKKPSADLKKAPPSKNSAFGPNNEEDDDVKETKIDIFDKDVGAYDESIGPEKPKGLLIIESSGNSDWKKISAQRFNPQRTQSNQKDDGKKLEYGINFIEKNTSKRPLNGESSLLAKEAFYFKNDVAQRPDVSTLEEYEQVPVEEFGAAMLRGMGWKEEGSEKDAKSANIVKKEIKRGQFQGLGAKPLPGDSNNSYDRYYNPVKKVDRDTGIVINESESREKSPKREHNNYRSRI